MIAFFLWLTGLVCIAEAAPNAPVKIDGVVQIRATVSEDLQTIQGEIKFPNDPTVQWLDLLAQLPSPIDDRTAQRTWVQGAESGWIEFESKPKADRAQHFHTILPRRTGATGLVPRRGIFSNGLWHPHPVVSGRTATVDWDVEIQLPQDTVGTLNGHVGKQVLRWTGHADRLSLAVMPQARIQRFPLAGDQELILIDGGISRPQRDKRVVGITESETGLPGAKSIVVVETPDRRRLARTGPGTVYLSDRATRLTGTAWRYHKQAIRRALYAASINNADPWARDLAASVLADAAPQQPDAREYFKWLSWLPTVDSLLYRGTLPFVSDFFDETWPDDPIADDPLEIVDQIVPGHVAARKLAGLYGENATRSMSAAILAGSDVDTAANLAEIPIPEIGQWRRLPPPQDVRVEVDATDKGWRIDLHRDTESSAPEEAIPVTIDGQKRSWRAGPGADHEVMTTMTRPKRVQLDPNITVKQEDRSNDYWPTRWTITAAGQIPEITLRTGRPTASAYLTFRERYSSRWLYAASISTNPVDLVALDGSISYGHGPRTDRRTHIWRSWLSPRVSLLDPQFAGSQTTHTAVELAAGIRKDTRTAWPISTRGHRFAFGVSQGHVLGTQEKWSQVGTSAQGLFSPFPHFVVANRVHGGSTNAQPNHRKLALGGSNGVQGLPLAEFLGHSVVIGSTEIRWRPIHSASIPLGLLWVSHMQLSAGMDAGILWHDSQSKRALGWSGGLAFVADLLGRRPALLGLWAAGTLPDSENHFVEGDEVQFYLRATQAF